MKLIPSLFLNFLTKHELIFKIVIVHGILAYNACDFGPQTVNTCTFLQVRN